MLNQSKVLKFIKDGLAFPHMFIELDDEKIIEYFTDYTLPEFSRYFPHNKKQNLDLNLENNKVPARANEYYIYDHEGLEILNVRDVIFGREDSYFFNHPVMGPMSYGELDNWMLQSELANRTKTYSDWNRTWEFIHPNVLRIAPIYTLPNNVVVEYETIQPSDLRGIPNEFQRMFCNLAAADIKMVIGRIRKRYGDGRLNTPFGEVELNSDIYDEGQQEREKIIEKLEETLVPNARIDIG